jgi:hypothetical protein
MVVRIRCSNNEPQIGIDVVETKFVRRVRHGEGESPEVLFATQFRNAVQCRRNLWALAAAIPIRLIRRGIAAAEQPQQALWQNNEPRSYGPLLNKHSGSPIVTWPRLALWAMTAPLVEPPIGMPATAENDDKASRGRYFN